MIHESSEPKTTENNHHLKIRHLQLSDFKEIKKITEISYKSTNESWDYKDIENLINVFPEGQFCVEDNGKAVAYALAIIVDYKQYGDQHTFSEITGNSKFSTHTKNGDVLYGIEVCIHPDYRGMRLGRRLYDARKELCENLNLKSIVAGGRMPGYSKHSKKLKPSQYIEKVKSKEIYDPVLSFQLSNDFYARKILTDYLPSDTESHSYATLLEWRNIYYIKKDNNKKTPIGQTKEIIRIGVVQWQMRNVKSIESFFENVEFFVDSVSSYKADFLLFPELVNAPLMADFNEVDAAKAIRKLAQYTEEIRDKFIEFALSYNINIIAGSLPLYEKGDLYNVSYLCRRDGTYETQYKIHITPSEFNDWGMKGGSEIQVFETDVAKIGILICYDNEFPELGRILARQGMQILFVPFSTDIINSYQRVRICSQARAIENECYVAIAGSVGNLPKVKNMDVQYAQSGVFSPSDISFPSNAVVTEGTPNTEMTIIADVNLDLLKELHTHGNVKNLQDRRLDLYDVVWKNN